ncbi:MAG: hypothetical protein ACHQ9S_08665 [Candidatus Binatia bacterium]
MGRVVLAMAGVVGLISWLAVESAQAVQACSNPNPCAQVSIGGGTGMSGDTVTVDLSFKQGPDDGHPGGIDEIAAIALTVDLGAEGAATPALTLADCTLSAIGLPKAIKPAVAISSFNVVVQNTLCSNGRTHCLCPDPASGITPDAFVNLAIYGPNLQTLSWPIVIPTLPNGQLLTIDLQIGPSVSGTIPLHVLNASTDSQHPKSTALLSIGDRLENDQTCVPIPGTPPCGAPGAVSQVAAIDGSIIVAGPPTPTLVISTPTSTPVPTATAASTATNSPMPTATETETPTATPVDTPTLTATPASSPTATLPAPCVGDCNLDHVVTVDEVLTMVNIALGNASLSECMAGDANGDHRITVDEILTAVTNALNGCGAAR